jgi:glucan phosphoethanolaminetransferase (alkaline phosphatase superfamily)
MSLVDVIIRKIIENLQTILIFGSCFALSFSYSIRKKQVISFTYFGLGTLVFFYLNGIISWLSGLGGDSYLEAKYFNEAGYSDWIDAFLSIAPEIRRPLDKVALVILTVSATLAILFAFFIRLFPRFGIGLPIILIYITVFYSLYLVYGGFKEGRDYAIQLKSDFSNPPEGVFLREGSADVFVYIGESTSTLNMSLYGYPYPTTPRIDQLSEREPGFIRFDNVLSTHSHTTPSLLRALSIVRKTNSGTMSNWGIGSVVRATDLDTSLVSTQPSFGSFGAFSPLVFEGISSDWDKIGPLKGNFSKIGAHDGELLESALKAPGVVFFHSYAGHWPYLQYVEKNFEKDACMQSGVFAEITGDGIFGSGFSQSIQDSALVNVRDYHCAISYVDYLLSSAIQHIKNKPNPAALLYFSDHGEAIFTKRGHDSSRYIHEMVSVPVIMFFNDAYRSQFPSVVERYRQAATRDNLKLLDQIAPSIIDVARVSSRVPLLVRDLSSMEDHPRPFIMERSTANGGSRRLDVRPGKLSTTSVGGLTGETVTPTFLSTNRRHIDKEITTCYHRSNTFAKALRAAAVTKCLEVDLTIDGDRLNIYHPPTVATGFTLNHVFDIAATRRSSLWIDAKNIDHPSKCDRLADFLENNYQRVGKILVEFPPDSFKRVDELKSCADRISKIGAKTSYYVPTTELIACSKSRDERSSACAELKLIVSTAINANIFSDLSFDFAGFSGMSVIPESRNLRWNTWAIAASDVLDFSSTRFDFVIVNSVGDPNGY